MRLNTRTGETSNLSRGLPSGPGTFLIDDQGTPRVRVITRSGTVTVHYRDLKSDQWRVLAEFPALGGDGFIPLRVRRDGTILVDASNGRDTRALYVYDPSAGRIDPQPVVAVEGFDFEGTPVWELGSDRLLGVHVNTDGAGTVWLDPRLKEIQKLIDTALPGLVNRISVPLRPATATLLVTSYSDAQPPVYAVFDSDKRALTRFARARPGIDPKSLGRTDFVRVKARDGLELPLYFTLPLGVTDKGPLPTVVLLHGGPWMRGSRWDWDAEAQLLASRGYLVLEPEFRGSTGYGDFWSRVYIYRDGWHRSI
jgi:dipeptidyl aminopeptidase/acylaminoacyl peptidase